MMILMEMMLVRLWCWSWRLEVDKFAEMKIAKEFKTVKKVKW